MKTNASLRQKNTQRTNFGKTVFRSNLTRSTGHFDWYIGTKEMMFYLDFLKIDKNSRMLIFGCGNSSELKRDVF